MKIKIAILLLVFAMQLHAMDVEQAAAALRHAELEKAVERTQDVGAYIRQRMSRIPTKSYPAFRVGEEPMRVTREMVPEVQTAELQTYEGPEDWLAMLKDFGKYPEEEQAFKKIMKLNVSTLEKMKLGAVQAIDERVKAASPILSHAYDIEIDRLQHLLNAETNPKERTRYADLVTQYQKLSNAIVQAYQARQYDAMIGALRTVGKAHGTLYAQLADELAPLRKEQDVYLTAQWSARREILRLTKSKTTQQILALADKEYTALVASYSAIAHEDSVHLTNNFRQLHALLLEESPEQADKVRKIPMPMVQELQSLRMQQAVLTERINLAHAYQQASNYAIDRNTGQGYNVLRTSKVGRDIFNINELQRQLDQLRMYGEFREINILHVIGGIFFGTSAVIGLIALVTFPIWGIVVIDYLMSRYDINKCIKGGYKSKSKDTMVYDNGSGPGESLSCQDAVCANKEGLIKWATKQDCRKWKCVTGQLSPQECGLQPSAPPILPLTPVPVPMPTPTPILTPTPQPPSELTPSPQPTPQPQPAPTPPTPAPQPQPTPVPVQPDLTQNMITIGSVSMTSAIAQIVQSLPLNINIEIGKAGLDDAILQKYIIDSDGGYIIGGITSDSKRLFLMRILPDGSALDASFGDRENPAIKSHAWWQGDGYLLNCITGKNINMPSMTYTLIDLSFGNGNITVTVTWTGGNANFYEKIPFVSPSSPIQPTPVMQKGINDPAQVASLLQQLPINLSAEMAALGINNIVVKGYIKDLEGGYVLLVIPGDQRGAYVIRITPDGAHLDPHFGDREEQVNTSTWWKGQGAVISAVIAQDPTIAGYDIIYTYGIIDAYQNIIQVAVLTVSQTNPKYQVGYNASFAFVSSLPATNLPVAQ